MNQPADVTPAAPAEAAPVQGLAPPQPSPAGVPWWQERWWAWFLLVLSAVAALMSVLLWQKIDHLQQELARRSQDAGIQAVEARALAQQAQDGTRDLMMRLGSMESQLGEVSSQRRQLEELMQSLSRSRDENLVVDIESALRLAQQQAQLTGSPEPLLAALRSAELRLQRAAQPRLTPLLRAITQDADRIKAATITDIPTLLIKLDELVRLVDELPVANDALPAARASEPTPSVRQDSARSALGATAGAVQEWLARAWSGAVAAVQDEARQLLRISRIDRPEAALLAPEQAFFLRENTKLKLLNARLALLSRQTDVARADLQAVQQFLQRYFDAGSRKTQVAAGLLQQIQSQLKSTELPRLDQSLAALTTAAAGR